MNTKFIFIAALICIQAIAATSQDTDNVRFLVVGDWGGIPDPPYQTAIQYSVATQMGELGKAFQTQFQVSLGDNFYWDGVTDSHDKRFQATFESAFTAESLQTRWYILAGNHDHGGNITGQTEYSKQSHRWYFPDLFYSFAIPIPNSASNIQFVMIDTIVLCGMAHDTKDLAFKMTEEDQKLADVYWIWIEQQLRYSNANYLIVAGHYAVYSISSHGPNQCLLDNLLPMLYKYNVTAYFCGHDHNLQHLQTMQSNQSMDFFLTGAGDMVDPSTEHEGNVPPGSIKFHWAEQGNIGGFGYVEVDSKAMQFTYYDGRGSNLYQHTLYPRY